jgi:hypothetical protein
LTVSSELCSNSYSITQYQQGAVDYTRVLNTQSALLEQQDALASSRGRIVMSLITVYTALGGGWQVRQGKDYGNAEMKKGMGERTHWTEALNTPAPTLPAGSIS